MVVFERVYGTEPARCGDIREALSLAELCEGEEVLFGFERDDSELTLRAIGVEDVCARSVPDDGAFEQGNGAEPERSTLRESDTSESEPALHLDKGADDDFSEFVAEMSEA